MASFSITSEVYRGRSRIVYRGRRMRDDQPVIIKTFVEGGSPPAGASLVREHEILRDLEAPGVARTFGLERHEGSLALLLEDVGGERLKTLIGAGRIDLDTFLDMAIQLASTVAAVHERNIIHKDINPNNILVNRETGRLALIDFSISSRLPSERQSLSHPSVLEGTIAYMAPEQTGRMNRDIDYRSDFYSLGVTFYEMLTGRLPFESADPLEVVHHHIAKTPPAPSDLDASIPRPLSNIVMKLLAKTAEERYQSALGLKLDLQRCVDEKRTTGRIESVVAGAHDVSDRFAVSQRLYGRENEIAQLLAAFERACRGPLELVMVSGYSGIGKTSVIHEIHKSLTHRKGYFITGKFDQLVRNVPYGGIARAFQSLVRQLLTESEASIGRWREELLAALGTNAQVVVDVIPELALLLGPQPPVPPLGAAESKNRFDLYFHKFLGAFAQPEHPLVIFLDDLQWADLASLGLLQTFTTNPGVGHLLMIGAFRDNEVTDSHPLRRTLGEIEKAGVALHEIGLGPLGQGELGQFVADTLRSDTPTARPLTDLVQEKTEGNPFFVAQFLKSVHQEGLLRFDRGDRRWSFDLAGIRRLGMTDNVVDLMVSRIRKLPPAAQEVLQLAACIGNAFDLGTLATIREKSPAEAAAEMWPAVERGLVVPLGARESYSFLHDRVQQAAYAMIPHEARRQVHLRVGRLMLAHSDPAALDERLFDIVQQLDYGADLIEDAAERARLAELNRAAGLKAKAATAYAAALGYFEVAARLLPPECWSAGYETTFTLHLQIAECEYLCGRFERADEVANQLLARARTDLDRAAVYKLRVVQRENQERYGEAVEAAKAGLRELGIVMPETEAEKTAAFAAEAESIRDALAGRDIADLVDLPVLNDTRVEMCMRLLTTSWASAYIAADRGLIALIPSKIVSLSLEHGNAPESAFGYVGYGISLGTGLGDYATGYEFGKLALAVNDRFHDLGSRAKVQEMFSCFVKLWCDPFRSCIPHGKEAYRSGLESGDFTYACYGTFHESWYGLLTSADLATFLEEYAPNVGFLEKIKMPGFADLQRLILHWALSLQGKTSGPGSLSSAEFDDAKFLTTYEGSAAFFETFYFIVRLVVLHAFEAYDEARAAAARAERVVHALTGTIWPVLLDFHQALVLAASYPAADAPARAAADGKLVAIETRLAVWARNCPVNFAHMHRLVAAERARLAGRLGDAVGHFEAALRAAAECDMPGDRALASELYARFWMERGQNEIAAVFLNAARDTYAGWGADAKSRDLEQRYPEILRTAAARHSARAADGLAMSFGTLHTQSGTLDLSSVVRAAQVLSGEIDLEKLLSKLMTIVIQNAGAERGFLVLESDRGPVVRAEGSVEPGSARLLEAVRLEDSPELSSAAVNYVRRTRDSLVIADATTDARFASDAYVMRRHPRSILCTPLLYQGALTGTLYLENNLAPAAFTPERIEIVQTLSSQTAIAIRNAELFAEVTRLRDRLQAENVYLQEEIKTQTGFEDIVGKSPALRKVLRQVEQVAPTDTTVLVLGETGTGKELIARAIHALSTRKDRPLVTLNCGAISPGLVESELFGHEKGAFTGALVRKIGRFELADGGTLFLDEIGDLPLDLQVKLLRVLQEGQIERVGGTRTIDVDVRVIAATHADLGQLVEAGRFRSDLFYRLNVFPVETPALRQRREDIPALVRHFVLHFATKLGRKIESIPRGTLDALTAYGWPGNVRELRNVIERSVIVSKGTALELGDWIPGVRESAPTGARRLQDVEHAHILRVLEECGWRVSGAGGAAEVLDLKPTTLEARMKKLGIQRPR